MSRRPPTLKRAQWIFEFAIMWLGHCPCTIDELRGRYDGKDRPYFWWR
jgi:hypothetical protein